MKSYIWITTQREGYHRWADAPKEVEFLRNLHRHIFKFKVWIELLEHNDREIEFFIFKRFVDSSIKQLIPVTDERFSCEMLSDMLFEKITKQYPKREIWIEVSEDGENGSFKTYPVGRD